MIPKGSDYRKVIDEHVDRARIMVMLVSEDYLAPTCGAADCEIKPALDAADRDELTILPIPVRRSSYSLSPLRDIMAALDLSRPLTEMAQDEQQAALEGVYHQILRILGLDPRDFDVFLSHNSKDKPAVRQLAQSLRERGLQVWLDEWELPPGRPWQEEIEGIINSTRSVAVLVGSDGLGPWEEPEMRACLGQYVKRTVPVIPVLLPGVSKQPELPLFLANFTWVDLRGGLTNKGLDHLEWGITGKKPGQGWSAAPTTSSTTADSNQVVKSKTSPEPGPDTVELSLPTIGIITALPMEFAAMRAILLQDRETLLPGQGAGRRYVIGRIPSLHGGNHSVVLALAGMGNNIAAARATLLLEHFNSVDAIIMGGIAGGVPYTAKSDEHVRLGDIVVSNKKGVIQYDYVKLTEVRACPVAPSAKLIEAVQLLQAEELKGNRPWDTHIKEVLEELKWRRPKKKADMLYASDDPNKLVEHPRDPKRLGHHPRLFFGPIASANELLKDPAKRDSLRDRFGVKAVEMEGSGIADGTWSHERGYLVVRGVCDYCDSHKNDLWQEYAAAVGAGYVRALIESMFVTSAASHAGVDSSGANPH